MRPPLYSGWKRPAASDQIIDSGVRKFVSPLLTAPIDPVKVMVG